MNSPDDHLAAAVQISRELARERAKVAAGRAALPRAVQLRAQLAPEIWDAYHLEGNSAPHIGRLTGISHDTVRRIVGSREHPTARPDVRRCEACGDSGA